MKILDLVYNIIVEEKMNADLMVSLKDKWGTEISDEEIEEFNDFFDRMSGDFKEFTTKIVDPNGNPVLPKDQKNALEKKPDGSTGFKPGYRKENVINRKIANFKEKNPEFNGNLKNIKDYSLKEIKDLYEIYDTLTPEMVEVANEIAQTWGLSNDIKLVRKLVKWFYKLIKNPDFDNTIFPRFKNSLDQNNEFRGEPKNLKSYTLNQIQKLSTQLNEKFFRTYSIANKLGMTNDPDFKEKIEKVEDFLNKNRDNLVDTKNYTRYIKNGESITSDEAYTTNDNGERVLLPGVFKSEGKREVPEIKNFRRKYPNFNGDFLNINSYTYDEINFLLKQFEEEFLDVKKKKGISEIDSLIGVFSNKNKDFRRGTERGEIKFGSNLEKQKLSYEKLWNGNYNLLYNDNNGFRIYQIKNIIDATIFGYYVQLLTEKIQKLNVDPSISKYKESNGSVYGFSQWCISLPKDAGSMYSNYRQRGNDSRSFYFIIDDNKNPFKGFETVETPETLNNEGEQITNIIINRDNLNYLGALQATPTGVFRFSNLQNPGEPRLTNDELFDIYPQLNNEVNGTRVINLISPVEFNNSELGEITSIIDLANENPNSNNYFITLLDTPQLKRQYIDSGKYLKTKECFDSLSDVLKTLYIKKCTKQNFLERFSTVEIFDAVENSSTSVVNTLKDHFRTEIPNGLGELGRILLAKDYGLSHRNKKNKNIVLFKEKLNGQNPKFGLFDNTTGKWYFKNGISYKPPYYEKSYIVKNIEDGQKFWVSIYTKEINGQPNNESFVEVFDFLKPNKFEDRYMFTYPSWRELYEKNFEPLISSKTGKEIPGQQANKTKIDRDLLKKTSQDLIRENKRKKR